jgi:hypothetical protein
VVGKVRAGARQPVVVMAEDLCNAAQSAPRRYRDQPFVHVVTGAWSPGPA